MSLSVNDISFCYHGGRKILEHITFQAERGQVLCILGPNGTGKTTLLKCLNCVLEPAGGTVLLDGADISKMKAKQRARSIAYVPQYHNAVFPMTVADTVMMGRMPYAGRSFRREDRDIVFEIIEKMGLSSFAFRTVSQMSGGERQRVFIARALAQEAEYILLDEPTSSLDLKNQIFTLETVKELALEKNLGVVLSIHDLNLAAMYGDSMMMLKDSHIFEYGKPEKVLRKDSIREVYGVDTVVTTEDGYPHIRLRRL